ncbi:DUF4126 domain-containing protein [Flavihumibacter solisilvae]|uniref:DUF4126 domain-containing protein n=1 Tax=Flavihumibacter solisilvae TaxID=1349421 RepID=A0A0C1IFP3_9BACT|nr:DUF4126 domain-containing protein [Flavihumibacter solisilvae]KIC92965.1 hypothetical protein OI18_19615 [Flavihumibacter solisilvae]
MYPIISAVCLGIALSACCGFRVFLPLLGASVAAYFGWIPLNPEMQWMAGLTAIISFGTAAVLEVLAYYIPFVDNLLDAIATPLAVVAGTVLAASFLPLGGMDPLLRWGLGLIAGGGTAGIIQAGTGFLRLLSTKTTAGTGNAVLATGENLAAAGGTIASLLVPVLAAILTIGLVVYLVVALIKRLPK